MYSSLDRVDLALKKDADGRQQFIQTDHRSAEEVRGEPELSTLFAAARILNPKRLAEAGSPEPLVLYSARERPPEFLRRVIRASGGRLCVGDDFAPLPDEGETPALEEILGTAFAGLARAVAAEFDMTLTAAALGEVERRLAAEVAEAEGDEIIYWSAVMKLGSFGGEVIRGSNGGRWVVVTSGTLPFALSTRFQGGEGTVNPLGKAIKRFANGEEDSLVPLVGLVQSQP